MIFRFCITGCLLLTALPSFSQGPPPPTIRHVYVEGNVRVPPETILHSISAAPGKKFIHNEVEADLRRLHDLGIFEFLEIREQAIQGTMVDLTYLVRERPWVSDFVIDGVGQGEREQISHFLEREKLAIRPTTPFRPGEANKAANAVRRYLLSRRYPLADVRLSTVPVAKGSCQLRLIVQTGPRLDIGTVRFNGNHSVSSGELLKQLQYLRSASLFAPWSVSGAYSPEYAAADLENLRRFYRSKGYAAVGVGRPEVVARRSGCSPWLPVPGTGGSEFKLLLSIPIMEGPRYRLVSVRSEGNARAAAADLAEVLATLPVPAEYDSSALESARNRIVDAMGRHGYAMSQVELLQDRNDAECTVRAVYRVESGHPMIVGRIEFQGNKRLRENLLRREIVVREGEVYDSSRLDESVRRLNRSGMVQPVQRADVALEYTGSSGLLDIVFHIKEKDRQGIYGTGGTGGIGGGYLGILYSAIDLLGFGESLAFQLDGGASQANAVLNIAGRHFLGFPFPVGLSVFHRVTHVNVASIVPDADDLIHLLRRRSTGIGLSGAYPVTSQVQVGLGARFERLSLSENSASDGGERRASVQGRTDLSPSFVVNAARGTGPETRGTRLALVGSLAGTTMLRTVDTTVQSFHFSQYLDDPLTRGRNSLAFCFQGTLTRPQNGVLLTSDRRLYPGDEIVRGFRRGGLSPWILLPGGTVPTAPAGADTVLGFSVEYRIPIQGPLSGAGFIDLGWSRLSAKNADFGTGSSLLDITNGMLRGSVGGELRLRLPLIGQPGRLIFSWNPLRMDRLIQVGPSRFRLADPLGAIRFALGDHF
ncbi:MAG: outer membrane protein assembly complex, YaeT protein [Acidobacteria bacterium]|nr:outer membrane protein assembly complex, YaeT protein [Acidobacteriota bacterium]